MASRHPTSYVISVFTIEDRILKELERLIEKAEQDPNAIFTDDNLPSEAYDNSAIKQIWKERINAAIQDWKILSNGRLQISTLQKRLIKKKKIKQRKKPVQRGILSLPLNSNSNVFGKRMKAKIDEVHGTYSRSDEKSLTKEYEELKNLWERSRSSREKWMLATPGYGTPVIKPKSGNLIGFLMKQNLSKPTRKTGDETGENVFVSKKRILHTAAA